MGARGKRTPALVTAGLTIAGVGPGFPSGRDQDVSVTRRGPLSPVVSRGVNRRALA
jgi:hypothetical protein